MRITVSIDDKVMKDLLILTNTKKKTEAISLAISEFFKRRGKEKLLSLRGKLHLMDNWRELREGELNEK